MHIVVLAIVGLAVLGGVVALLVGNRGWNWGTVIAGVLVLLAATGYLYLAVRILERERVWREVVSRYEADILAVRDAKKISDPGAEPQPIAKKSSIAELADTRSRWKRSLSRVETWRGRSWQGTGFTPPKEGAAGSIVLVTGEPAGGEPPAEAPAAEPPAGEAPAADAAPLRPPVNQGAEIAVFDATAVEEGGGFLGLFRVTMVEVDRAARRTTISIVPIADPDKHDLAAWSRPHDAVVIFENLPVDRWLGYHRTPGPALEPEKADSKKLLESVERRLAEFERHGEVVEGDPADLVSRITSGDVPPGRYWAEVRFEDDHDLDPKVVERIKLLLKPEISPDDPRGVRTSFAPGDTAAFDLETAVGLAGTVKILRVVDRRPLVDGATAILGGTLLPGEGGEGLRTDGISALRRRLEADIAALDREIQRLEAATDSVGQEHRVVAAEGADITADLELWRRDVAAAAATVTAFEGRLREVSQRLAAEVAAIGTLGRAVNDGLGRLAATIDQMAPPPGSAAPSPAPSTP